VLFRSALPSLPAAPCSLLLLPEAGCSAAGAAASVAAAAAAAAAVGTPSCTAPAGALIATSGAAEGAVGGSDGARGQQSVGAALDIAPWAGLRSNFNARSSPGCGIAAPTAAGAAAAGRLGALRLAAPARLVGKKALLAAQQESRMHGIRWFGPREMHGHRRRPHASRSSCSFEFPTPACGLLVRATA